VQIVGYANPILASRLSSDIDLLRDFLAYIKENSVSIDIFSYHNYDSPSDQRKVAQAVRDALDANGFSHLPIWNTEWNMWGGDIPRAIFRNELEHSAYIAAHNAQTKTLLQGLWDNAITYRANRPSDRNNQRAAEYMYFESNGTPKPAYYGWYVFRQMETQMPERLSVSPPSSGTLTIRQWQPVLHTNMQFRYAISPENRYGDTRDIS